MALSVTVAVQALLDELDYTNLVKSPVTPWASPSPWLRDWIQRARLVFISSTQIILLDELQYKNDQVSPSVPWASPSPAMKDWSDRMKATM